MRKQRCLWMMVAGLVWPGPLWAGTQHTPLDPSLPGGITGRLAGVKTLQNVIAIEPYEMKAYAGKVDRKAGAFEFRGLPPGEYDLLIKAVGRTYEGLTLKLESNWQSDPRKLRKLKKEVAAAFSKTEDFFNVKHVARLAATDTRARMLAVQTRTRRVVDPGGRPIRGHIRRFDLLDLVKTRKVWQVAASRHLLRQEVPYKSPDIKIKLTYIPKLGGILVGERVKDMGRIDLKKLATTRPAGPAGAKRGPTRSGGASSGASSGRPKDD
jgi:hypothetical protein